MLKLVSTLVVFCFFAVAQGENAPAPAGGSKWVPLPGHVEHISGKGDKLWAVTRNLQILRYAGDGWETHHGRANDIAAAADGSAWIIDNFYRDPNEKNLLFTPKQNDTPHFTAWTTVGNVPLVDISAFSANDAVGIDDSGAIVQYDKETKTFKRLDNAGYNNRDVSIGDKNERWRIDQNDVLYRLDGNDWKEQKINAAVTPAPIPISVSVGGPDRVAVVDALNEIYFYNGKEWKGITTAPDDHKFHEVSVGVKFVYALTENGQVFKREI